MYGNKFSHEGNAKENISQVNEIEAYRFLISPKILVMLPELEKKMFVSLTCVGMYIT